MSDNFQLKKMCHAHREGNKLKFRWNLRIVIITCSTSVAENIFFTHNKLVRNASCSPRGEINEANTFTIEKNGEINEYRDFGAFLKSVRNQSRTDMKFRSNFGGNTQPPNYPLGINPKTI